VRTSTRGALLIATLALVWGSNLLWIKIALESFSPVQLTATRMILGALVLLAVAAIRRGKLPRDLVTWGHLSVAALVANVAPYLLFALGETRVDSGIAGALNATTPLWTLTLAFLVHQTNRLGVSQATGLVFGFVGSLLIFTPWEAGSVDTQGAFVNYALIRTEGPVGASVVTYLGPVASVVLGFLVLDESVPFLSVLGVATILVGVRLSRRRPALRAS
jgi:drug/metabolite transporter (DMT)-like permease